MSSFLRPRRGKQSTAASTLTASNPLKRGEIFFEVPTGGVGTGTGKLKMGDGSTAYANLPYFLSMDDSAVTFTDSSASSSWNNYSNYLANIKTGITLPTFFANTKNLLYQLCNKVTLLNNDLSKKSYGFDLSNSSVCSSGSLNIYKFGDIKIAAITNLKLSKELAKGSTLTILPIDDIDFKPLYTTKSYYNAVTINPGLIARFEISVGSQLKISNCSNAAIPTSAGIVGMIIYI